MNEQLLAYVKVESAKGVPREDILRVLLAAGWQILDINNVFIALGLPPQPVSGGQSPAAPAAAPQPPVAAPAQSVSQSIVMPVHQASAASPAASVTAMPQQPSSNAMPGALPGVFALLKQGFALYKERFSVLFVISCIELAILLSLFTLLPFGMPKLIALMKVGPLLVAGVFASLFFSVFILWLLLWVALALLFAIQGSSEHIGVGESFRRARSRVRSLLWLGMVSGFTLLGGVVVFAVLPAALVAVGAYLTLGSTAAMIFGTVGIVVGVIGVLVSLMLLGTWFSLSHWCLVDTGARGVGALLMSKRLVHGRFWAVLWRVFGTSFLLGLAVGVISAFAHLFALPFPAGWQSLANSIIAQVINTLLFSPIFLGTFFSLYAAVRSRAGSVDTSKGRGSIIALSITGVLGAVILPIVFVALAAVFFGSAFLSGLSGAASRGADAVRESDIATLQVGVELYKSEHNAFPSSLEALIQGSTSTIPLSATSLQDPVTHAPFSYTLGDGGASYTLCATLSTGESFCKSFSGTVSPGVSASSTPAIAPATTSPKSGSH